MIQPRHREPVRQLVDGHVEVNVLLEPVPTDEHGNVSSLSLSIICEKIQADALASCTDRKRSAWVREGHASRSLPLAASRDRVLFVPTLENTLIPFRPPPPINPHESAANRRTTCIPTKD